MQRERAHEGPNHYCRHLRRPCPLDGHPTFAYDGDAESVTKNFEAENPQIISKSLTATRVDRPPGATFVPHTYAESSFTYAYFRV
jgi:hypothetical protein